MSLLSVSLIAAGLTPVHAAPSADDAQQEDAARRRARAHALYEQSKTAYNAGEFGKAAELLEQAYELFQTPVLLYNLARAKESAGDSAGALSAYRRYLDSDTQIEDRAAIERRISTLEDQLREQARANADRERAIARAREAERAAEHAKSESAQPATSPTPWPWVLIGTGAATLIAGGAFGVLARNRESSAANAESQLAAQDAFEQGERYASVANVLFAVGGAVTLAGSVWLGVELLATDSHVAVRSRYPAGARGSWSLRLGGAF